MDCTRSKALIAGHLLSDSSDLTSGMMDDVFDSLLYSQIYADKGGSKFDGPARWLSRCDDALHVAKWTLADSQRQADEPDNDAVISIKLLVEKYLLRWLPAAHATEVKTMIDCIAGLSDADPASLLLHRHTVRSPGDAQGHTTVVLLISALDLRAQLSLLSVTFTTTCAVNADLLRQVFPGSTIVGEVDVCYSRRIWSHNDYKSVRDRVQGVLAGRRDGLILPVCCKKPEVGSHGK